MKFSITTFLLFFFILTAASEATAQQADSAKKTCYRKQINELRARDDFEKRTDSLSPIPKDERASFEHLNYFRPKHSYCKNARIERFDNAVHFKMKTTTTRLPEYSVYGLLTFRHHFKKYQLFVYQNIELVKKPGYEKHLFVPYNDKTNGRSTYGGGRFIELEENGVSTITLDFNKAYNPYCAYNHKYSCPIPPSENRLNFNVRAGEKKWHD